MRLNSVRLTLNSACLTFVLLAASTIHAQSPYDSVSPLIGTTGNGNTFPGATLPFGMIQWSPDTNSSAWYYFQQPQITGFGLTHISGAGCSLYGDFAILPIAGDLTTSPGASIAPYAVAFDHATEQAHPGYYAVTLSNGVRVEITVAQRAGIARFTFPEGQPARLLINSGSSANLASDRAKHDPDPQAYTNQIALDSAQSFSGYAAAGDFCSSDSHYKVYVAGQFNKPYTAAKLWQDDKVLGSAKQAEGKHSGAWVDFGSAHEVELKVGLSYVSQPGAAANLAAEIPGFNFDEIHSTSRQIWTQQLSRIAADGGTPSQRIIFYTGLYHSLLSPNVFSDHDGHYIGFDNQVRSLSGTKQGAQYANFSDWDIYRNTVQLQALLDAPRESDMLQSLVNDAVQSGWYPRWAAANDVTYVMAGDSPIPVIASAYAFGARNIDTATALQYMVKAATTPGPGPHNNAERPFLADYLKLGYVPNDNDEISASRTLEYANDDFALAEFAKATNHPEQYKKFLKQSENWKNLLNPETGWITPRNADGSWLPGFDPETSLPKRRKTDGPDGDQHGFEEGNTWQYTFMLPFDYPALFAAIDKSGQSQSANPEHDKINKKSDKTTPRLDRFFLKLRCWGQPCYNIENEPDFVVPYAYDFAGQPWKTQEVVTRIGNEVFKPTPDGIPGNDDLGATSGVYLWDALGLYPAVPGVAGLALGTPMFDKVTLHLSGGRTVVITKTGPGIYVQKVTIDGVPYPKTWLSLDKLHPGTTKIDFTTSTVPNTTRGTAITDRPPSFR